ncbi:Zinc finger, ZZ type [Musa troglodytarum]|uniref:Zinc finger, ZZ type n=1 Tax=Musa troglodytarum TaxID=320322 RepID=A0A9E7L6B0_9LILI|nr:Zinc finger, ZZ type [Musa troglodytarum]
MSDAEEAKATASSPSAACPMAADGLDDEVMEEKATDVYSPQFADQLELKKLHIVYCESCLSGLSGEHLQCQVPEATTFTPHPTPSQKCWFVVPLLTINIGLHGMIGAKRKQNPMAQVPSRGNDLWLKEDISDVHVGVGCDSCGIYPIVGKRYKCKDCKEAIGFDLCEACYNSTSKLPGRFNQQHTPDHTFELDDSQMLRNILMQRGNLIHIPQQGPEVIYVPSDDELHDHENHSDDGSGG